MDIDADAVTGAVDEGATIPRLFDEAAGRAVHLLADHTRPDRIQGRLLRLPHDFKYLSLLLGGRSDEDGALVLRVIAVGRTPRPVDHHVPPPQRSAGGDGVRQRRFLSDRKSTRLNSSH